MRVSVETTARRLTGKPALVRCAAMKLRVSSAATTSSSDGDGHLRRRPARRAASSGAGRAATRSISPRRSAMRLGFGAWIAGARPASSAARNVAPSVNDSTRPSIRRSKASGIGSGRLSDATADVIHQASSVPAGGAEQRQHHRLGDELAHQPAAARADREADADFLVPARRARQQHARDVGARNQQHQPDDHHQPGGDRHDHRIQRRVEVHVARRLDRRCGDPCWSAGLSAASRDISTVRLARACSIVLPGLSRPRMNSQRSARRSRRVVPVGDGIASCIPTGSTSSDADTGIHISGERIGTIPLNAGRRHADDRVRRAADPQGAADGVGRRPELARPVAMRHHHDTRRARHVV